MEVMSEYAIEMFLGLSAMICSGESCCNSAVFFLLFSAALIISPNVRYGRPPVLAMIICFDVKTSSKNSVVVPEHSKRCRICSLSGLLDALASFIYFTQMTYDNFSI